MNFILKFSEAIFKKSSRGQRIIFLSGYRFCKNKVMGQKTYWQCATHKHRKCRAKLHTIDNDTIIKCYNVHNH